jgi:hypothetical protein
MSAAAAAASASRVDSAAGHAADHECVAGGAAGSLEQGGDARPFGIPADQHLSDATEPGPAG